MCSEYCFDVILTVPEAFRGELPETPEPTVKFLADSYINAYRFKPTDSIISDTQMRAYLKDNCINTDKCSIMQRPKMNTYEAIINGYQIYRVHWVIECEFDEDKHYMIIPKEAREFIDRIHEAIHENTIATLEIMNNSLPWEDSWIHKKISYAEFRSQGLCNRADEILDTFEQTTMESVQNALSEVKTVIDKRVNNMESMIFMQQGNLLRDVNQFKEYVKKQLAKAETPKEIVDYTKQIEELTKNNESLTNELKNSRLTVFCLTIMQVFIVGLLMFHYFTFK